MKKAILVILISGLSVSFSAAQKLLDIYKNGPVKLIADKTYGAKNNWETLFNLYNDTLTKGVGREEDKKIVLAPRRICLYESQKSMGDMEIRA